MTNYLNKRNSLRELSDEYFETNVSHIAQEIADMGFIYHSYSSEDLKKDWKSLCNKVDFYCENGMVVVSATCTIGMKCIRQYMPHFYHVRNYKGVSVHSLWTKEHLEKALRFNRKYHSTPYVSEIIRSLSFTNGLGKITIYRPIMAKNVISYYDVKTVLDVCVGWGGRMLGTKASDPTIHYTGIEPCVATYNGLCKIRDILGLEDITLINEPAEVALAKMNPNIKFDMAITSPPYYNLELYSEEETQSMNYGTYQEWLDNFLEPVIAEVVSRVTYSAWSIKNFKTDKKYNLLDDVIVIHRLYGWELDDVRFIMTNSKRPGASAKSGITTGSEEMTYIFIKRKEDTEES